MADQEYDPFDVSVEGEDYDPLSAAGSAEPEKVSAFIVERDVRHLHDDTDSGVLCLAQPCPAPIELDKKEDPVVEVRKTVIYKLELENA